MLDCTCSSFQSGLTIACSALFDQDLDFLITTQDLQTRYIDLPPLFCLLRCYGDWDSFGKHSDLQKAKPQTSFAKDYKCEFSSAHLMFSRIGWPLRVLLSFRDPKSRNMPSDMTHQEVRLSLDQVSLLPFRCVFLHGHIYCSLYLGLLDKSFSRTNLVCLDFLELICISKSLSNRLDSMSFRARLVISEASLLSDSVFISLIWLASLVLSPTSNQLNLTNYPNHRDFSSIWVFLFEILIYSVQSIACLNIPTRLSSIHVSFQAIQQFHISFYHPLRSNCF